MKYDRKPTGKKSVLQKLFEKFALLFSAYTTMADGKDDSDDKDAIDGDGSLVAVGVTSKTMNADSPFAGNVILCWMKVKNGKTTYVPLAALLTERQINDMTPVKSPDPLVMTNLFYSKMLDTVRDAGSVTKITPERYNDENSQRDYDFDRFTDDYINPWKNN